TRSRGCRAATSRTARKPAIQPRPLAGTARQRGGASAGPHSFRRRQDVARRDDAQHVEAAPVGAQHLELQAAEHERFAAAGQPAEEVHREAADRVVLLVAELAAEVLVEFLDARLRLDGELTL